MICVGVRPNTREWTLRQWRDVALSLTRDVVAAAIARGPHKRTSEREDAARSIVDSVLQADRQLTAYLLFLRVLI